MGWDGEERTYHSLWGVQAMNSINNNTDTVLQKYQYNTEPSGAEEDPQLH